MPKPAQHYNVDDFKDYKRKQGKCLPPRNNVLAAASHIQALFNAKKFTWGFMGGLAMLCLGYKREMPDLHISYDDKDFERLKSKLESDKRICLPTGVNPLLPFKILVWTGPEYKDQGCTTNASIELDLVPSGACGTPPSSTLSGNLVQLSLNATSGQHKALKCLNLPFLMTTMLSYCKARDLWWDPRKDILYLCKNQSVDIERMRSQLNVKQVQECFLGTSFFSRLPMEDQRLCYRLLLAKDPPPTMALTPPGPPVLVAARTKAPSEMDWINEGRAPRSRYRNVSAQRSGSSGTIDRNFTNDVSSQSMDHLQDPRRSFHIVDVQVVSSSKPQTVSAMSAARYVHRSMPNLLVANEQNPMSHTNTQVGKAVTGDAQHQPVLHTPSAQKRPNQQTKSQLGYGRNFQPAHETTKVGPRYPSQDPSETTTIESDSTKTSSSGTKIEGIHSQQASLHMVNSEEEEALRHRCFRNSNVRLGEELREELRLVGPGGLHVAPDGPRHITLPQVQHQRYSSAPLPLTESDHVFELDSTAPSKPTYFAELPADPVSLLHEALSAASRLNSCSDQPLSKPSNPRTASAPAGPQSLPASLVAGRPGARTYFRSRKDSTFSDEPMDGYSDRTNAYMYSTFVFPKPEDAKGSHACEDESAIPTYKAYRPRSVLEKYESESSRPYDDDPHKHSVSDGSTASHDSSKLAREYQELLNYEEGYGS